MILWVGSMPRKRVRKRKSWKCVEPPDKPKTETPVEFCLRFGRSKCKNCLWRFGLMATSLAASGPWALSPKSFWAAPPPGQAAFGPRARRGPLAGPALFYFRGRLTVPFLIGSLVRIRCEVSSHLMGYALD